jgi:hypothetical protein
MGASSSFTVFVIINIIITSRKKINKVLHRLHDNNYVLYIKILLFCCCCCCCKNKSSSICSITNTPNSSESLNFSSYIDTHYTPFTKTALRAVKGTLNKALLFNKSIFQIFSLSWIALIALINKQIGKQFAQQRKQKAFSSILIFSQSNNYDWNYNN